MQIYFSGHNVIGRSASVSKFDDDSWSRRRSSGGVQCSSSSPCSTLDHSLVDEHRRESASSTRTIPPQLEDDFQSKNQMVNIIVCLDFK